MTTNDILTLALIEYKELEAAYDHFMKLRSKILMDLTTCEALATEVRTAFSTFSADVLVAVKSPTTTVTPGDVDYTPLYTTLSGLSEDLKNAQAEIDALKTGSPVATPIGTDEPVDPTALPIDQGTPIVQDGPVLETSASA